MLPPWPPPRRGSSRAPRASRPPRARAAGSRFTVTAPLEKKVLATSMARLARESSCTSSPGDAAGVRSHRDYAGDDLPTTSMTILRRRTRGKGRLGG